MQRYACRDVGIECSFSTTGASKEETVKKAMQHDMKAHADMMKTMSREEIAQFTHKVENSIRPA